LENVFIRNILVIVLVFLIVIVGLPYYFGIQAEKEYKKLIEQSSEIANLVVKRENYERGIFKSKANTEYIIKFGPVDLVEINEEDTIYHGPITYFKSMNGNTVFKFALASVDTKAAIKPSYSVGEIKALFEELPFLNAITEISFGNSVNTEFSIPSRRGSYKSNSFNWKGMNGNAVFYLDENRVITSIYSPGLDLNLGSEDDGKKLELSINGIKSDTDFIYIKGASSLPIGKSFFLIESFVLKSKDTKSLILDKLEFVGNSTDKKDTIDSSYIAKLENIIINDFKAGPGEYELKIDNIDQESMVNIQNLVNEVSESKNPELNQLIIMGQLMQILPKLIEKSPKITIPKLYLMTQYGEINGDLSIFIDGDSKELSQNPLLVVQHLKGQTNLKIPKSLLRTVLENLENDKFDMEIKESDNPGEEINKQVAKKTDELIEKLIKENVFVEDGDSYKLNAKYENGELILNGKIIYDTNQRLPL